MRGDVRLDLGPGDGMVAALGDVAVFVVGTRPAEPVFDVVRRTGAEHRTLARRLVGLIASDEDASLPTFAVAAVTDDGILVVLHGPVEAVARAADGTATRLSGEDAAIGVDRVFGNEIVEVALTSVGVSLASGTSPYVLAAGVVPGGWLRLTRVGSAAPASDPLVSSAQPEAPPPDVLAAPATPAVLSTPTEPPGVAEPPAAPSPSPVVSPPPVPAPAPAPAAAAAATPPPAPPAPDQEGSPPFESIPLTPDPAVLREPLPMDTDDDPVAATVVEALPEPEDDSQYAHGILCSRQHFNSPDAGYCSSCGISMVHQTHNLVRRKRPPLGFLVFDDGTTFTLDARYVLGREPDNDELVVQGVARPIVLDDPQMTLSRVHAEIVLVEWDVHFIDRGSTNGSHILNTAGTAWERLVPGQPRVIPPGGRGAVGQRTFVYETSQRGG